MILLPIPEEFRYFLVKIGVGILTLGLITYVFRLRNADFMLGFSRAPQILITGGIVYSGLRFASPQLLMLVIVVSVILLTIRILGQFVALLLGEDALNHLKGVFSGKGSTLVV